MSIGFSHEKSLTNAALGRAWLAAALAFCGVSPVAAAELAGEYNAFEIAPFIGYVSGGGFEDPAEGGRDRDIDADTSFGVIFNIAADEWRHYEFLYSNQSTQIDGVTTHDADVQYFQLGGSVSLPEATRAIPYFSMTVGAAQIKPTGPGLSDETAFAGSIGGGVRVPITDHIGLRFDARVFVTLLDGDSELFCTSSSGAACRFRAESDTLLQYAASFGVIIGF